ncbi:MAG: small subunit ribosomal protein S11 [Candidatus Midichloriaceae bacterium]|jgi:small subunit ribosomal protein S11
MVKVKKKNRNVNIGIAHISATFNNTIITITNNQGETLTWSSAGCNGFKGSRKSTPYAAQVAAEEAAKKAMSEFSMKNISIEINGPGTGREAAVRGLVSAGLNVTVIKDKTPVPHNGTRPPKKRRV